MTSLVVVGDALLDRDVDGAPSGSAPDAPGPGRRRPSTAPARAAPPWPPCWPPRAGRRSRSSPPSADDAAGAAARAASASSGVDVIDLGLPAARRRRRSGCAAGGQSLLASTGRAARRSIGPLGRRRRASRSTERDVVLVSDYGRGVTRPPRGARRAGAARSAARWCGIRIRAVRRRSRGAAVTPNQAEAADAVRAAARRATTPA